MNWEKILKKKTIRKIKKCTWTGWKQNENKGKMNKIKKWKNERKNNKRK